MGKGGRKNNILLKGIEIYRFLMLSFIIVTLGVDEISSTSAADKNCFLSFTIYKTIMAKFKKKLALFIAMSFILRTLNTSQFHFMFFPFSLAVSKIY